LTIEAATGFYRLGFVDIGRCDNGVVVLTTNSRRLYFGTPDLALDSVTCVLLMNVVPTNVTIVARITPQDNITWNGVLAVSGPLNVSFTDDPPVPILFEIQLGGIMGDRSVDFEFVSLRGDEPQERSIELRVATTAIETPAPTPTGITKWDMEVETGFLVPLVIFGVAVVVLLVVAIWRHGLFRGKEGEPEDDSTLSRSLTLSGRKTYGSFR
jgi:hypothetical protein